jgi:ABC-type multidrug transport system fused ATPase/permease subunit/Ser/Thr protein kinase RdoA (MazF antagonist)
VRAVTLSPSIARDQTQAASRAPPRGDTARAIKLVLKFTEGAQRTFLIGLAMLVLEAAAAVFEAYPLAYLIDFLKGDRPGLHISLLGSERTATVAALTIALLGIAAINSLADSAAEVYLARGGRTLGYRLRVALYAHLQRLSLAFHDRRRTGDVITRVTGDVKELEQFVINSMSDVAGSALLLVGVLIFLGFHSWQVTLVGLAVIPMMMIVSAYFSKRIKKTAREQRAREGDLASATQEMLSSIRVVQTFGRAPHDEKRFAGQSGKAMDAALRAAFLEAGFSFVVSVLEALSIGAVIWIGLWLVDRGTITVGTLILFAILIGRMFRPTRRIIKEWNTIAKVYASVERIADLLDREVTVRDEPGAVPAPQLSGRVEFRDVSFAYHLDPQDAVYSGSGAERRQALKSVSFTIEPGEVVALVGHSGAGKTTIAQLVPRLYDPQRGQVRVDGDDVRSFTLESLRSQISIVLQETVLVSGTVAENIAYGRTTAGRDEIVAAALRANAHDFIAEMPNGYDTELSERASNLSGGQRQRIAIARAFIRSSPILILDEPTTGLDPESKDAVLLALRTLMKGKTTLVISHDPELIRAADRVLVLSEGAIVHRSTRPGVFEHEAVFEVEPGDGAANAGPGAVPMRGRWRRATRRNFRLWPAKGIDLRRSAGMREELPELEIALDAAAMRDRLQKGLVGEGRNGWSIERCTPGKAMYLPGEGCSVRYDLLLRDGSNGKRTRALVGGRLFREPDAIDSFVGERIAPLADSVRDSRSEIAPFATPAAVLSALPMAVFAFPIDSELPTLVEATDWRHMLDVFREAPPVEHDRALGLDACRVGVAHYPRRSRCVLRYDLEGRLSPGNEPSRFAVYGKLGTNNWAQVESVLTALQKLARDGTGRYRFRAPHVIAVHPELKLGLLEPIPGAPRISRLLEEYVTGGSDTVPPIALEEAVEICGHIAAVLHELDATVLATRPLEDELSMLRLRLWIVRRFSPELAAGFEELLAAASARAEASDPLPPVLSHGDYTHSQVLFDGAASGLIDFDAICRAEPALDLGQFCAYLRVACQKATNSGRTVPPGLAHHLCERFLLAYTRTAATPRRELAHLRERVAVYELVILLRMALHSWHQLKPARTKRIMDVLEERMSSPARLTA